MYVLLFQVYLGNTGHVVLSESWLEIRDSYVRHNSTLTETYSTDYLIECITDVSLELTSKMEQLQKMVSC